MPVTCVIRCPGSSAGQPISRPGQTDVISILLRNVPRQEAEQKCEKVPRQACTKVPREVCEQKPKQVRRICMRRRLTV